jgi:hypothetical protein
MHRCIDQSSVFINALSVLMNALEAEYIGTYTTSENPKQLPQLHSGPASCCSHFVSLLLCRSVGERLYISERAIFDSSVLNLSLVALCPSEMLLLQSN